MICPDCDGRGTISRPYIPALDLYTISPCETCGGCGVAHCCDGDTMPEPPSHEPGGGSA